MNRPERPLGAALRYAFPAALALAALLSVAQMWGHFHWLWAGGDQCDFPDDCLERFYPKAFPALTRLWFISAVVGWILFGWSVLVREARSTVLRIGVAGGASFLWFFLTPVSRGRDINGWFNSGHPVDPGPSYMGGMMLLFLAALLYIWELLVRSLLKPSKRREAITAQEPVVQGNAGPVTVPLVGLVIFVAAWYAVLVAATHGWIVSVVLGVALGSLVPAMRRRTVPGVLVGITAGSGVVTVVLGTLALAT